MHEHAKANATTTDVRHTRHHCFFEAFIRRSFPFDEFEESVREKGDANQNRAAQIGTKKKTTRPKWQRGLWFHYDTNLSNF